MLGRRLFDPLRVESQHDTAEGLGLLGFDTEFAREKRTTQVELRARTRSFLAQPDGAQLFGYEIHLGRLRRDPDSPASFSIHRRNGAGDDDLDGEVSADGNVVGTMVHGLFENPSLRRTLLSNLRARRGLQAPPPAAVAATDEYDRLATAVREHLDLRQLFALIGR
jgi:adenosylcobyric acid synthase